MTETLAQLTDLGVSVWLDDLSRQRIESGNLQTLISERNVRGVTTNPTIFAQALSSADDYSAAVRRCREMGLSAEQSVFEITSEDVKDACDIFHPVFEETGGVDGRVSIEVSPMLANDTEATVAQAKELWQKVDKENLMIKIPATKEGLPAITEVIASGISVNVTLIFSLNRYAKVIDAYIQGIRQAHENGHDVSKIHSVASFLSPVSMQLLISYWKDTRKRLQSFGARQQLPMPGSHTACSWTSLYLQSGKHSPTLGRTRKGH